MWHHSQDFLQTLQFFVLLFSQWDTRVSYFDLNHTHTCIYTIPVSGAIHDTEEIPHCIWTVVRQNQAVRLWELLQNAEVGQENQLMACSCKPLAGVHTNVEEKASSLTNTLKNIVSLWNYILDQNLNPHKILFLTSTFKSKWEVGGGCICLDITWVFR